MKQLTLSKSSAFSLVAMVLYLVHPMPNSKEVGASHLIRSVLPCVLDTGPDPSVHPCFLGLLPPLLPCTPHWRAVLGAVSGLQNHEGPWI